MSERITSENLDKIVALNAEIHEEVANEVNKLNIGNNIIPSPSPQAALGILNKHGLIQIPIRDSYFSGAIFVRGLKLIPVINTNQIRANQYFTAWHEIYHLYFDRVSFNHYIEDEPSLEERKAEHFASLIMLRGLMDYYRSLSEADFLLKVFMCMSMFQAPYKAVLIGLYENSIHEDDHELQMLILQYFDQHFDDLPSLFQQAGLDSSLVTPSMTINCSMLAGRIRTRINSEPDVDYHMENLRYFEQLLQQLSISLED